MYSFSFGTDVLWRIFGTDVYHMRGLCCSSDGGCVTEAKSHNCIEERTSDVVISAFGRRTGGCSEYVDALRFCFQHTNRHTSNPSIQKFSTSYNSAAITSSSGRFFMLSLQSRLRRCIYVCLLLLPSSPCMSFVSIVQALSFCSLCVPCPFFSQTRQPL